MRFALCPSCQIVHEAVGPVSLVGLDPDRAYQQTHCRLCDFSSGQFLPLKDASAPLPNDIGYPAAVVPLFEDQYRDWWLVGPDQLAMLANAGLRVRLLRHLSDEMLVPATLVVGWIGLRPEDALNPSAGKTLDPSQALRLLWIARLIGQAQAIVDGAGRSAEFDGSAWMEGWLQAPHPTLGGVSPGDYLRLPEGTKAVSDLLARAESGSYS